MTGQEVAAKFEITEEQVADLKRAMVITWDSVADDWGACFEGGWSEAYELYESETEMIAEATIDADRIVTFCSDMDLGWVYKMPDGSYRLNTMAMAKSAWESR